MIKLVKGVSLNNQFPFSYVIYNDNKVMEIFYNVLDNRVYFYFETYEFIDEYTMYNIFNRFNNLIINYIISSLLKNVNKKYPIC